MNVNRLRILCIKICKTINNVNPEFMRDLCSLRETSRLIQEEHMLNLSITVHNQVTFGSKSVRVFGSKFWNSLPYHIKSSENLELFKMIIRHWNGTRCSCKVCNTTLNTERINLGILKRPRCTILEWLLIITRCCNVDITTVENAVSGFCTQILYNFNPMFLLLDALTTRLLILS